MIRKEDILWQNQKFGLLQGVLLDLVREIAKKAIVAGYKVVATARNLSQIEDFKCG